MLLFCETSDVVATGFRQAVTRRTSNIRLSALGSELWIEGESGHYISIAEPLPQPVYGADLQLENKLGRMRHGPLAATE